jgi:hypothetical protein
MKLIPDSPPPFKLFGKNIFYFLNKIIKSLYFFKFILVYNTFIFISPSTILKNYKDIPILKFFRKKIVLVFCGCNERDPSFDIKNPDWICNNCKDTNKQENNLCTNLKKKKEKVRFFENYADYIIAQEDLVGFLNKKEYIWFYVFSEKPQNGNKLKKFNSPNIQIVHFPSNNLIKQSHKIIPILKKIQKAGIAEVIIKNGIWSRTKILNTLNESHILVDQFGAGYTTIGVEAFARGCVVLNRNDEWFMEKVPQSPVYKTSSKTLYEDLVYLINHRDILNSYAERSINFYKKYHTLNSLGKYYKKQLRLK